MFAFECALGGLDYLSFCLLFCRVTSGCSIDYVGWF